MRLRESDECVRNDGPRRIRIALGAQSFGFGPASKAAAIAKTLRSRFPRVEVVCCAEGVSREYLTREGVWRADRDIALDDMPLVDLSRAVGRLDAALVVLDPELTTFFHSRVPTYFVDSLGFMWGREFLERYPAVREATRYFVQDAFGAARRLTGLGVRNVHPVGAIIGSRASMVDYCPELVVNLGGLLNTFSEHPVRDYVDGVMRIVDELGAGRDTLVLTSERARDRFDALSAASVPVRALPHDQAAWMFGRARTVLTSPGLTTLLELARDRVPAIPLPPQNMSQALIIVNITTHCEGMSPIWHFLEEHYPLKPGIDEESGVKLVQETNGRLLFDSIFVKSYLAAVEAALSDPRPLPPSLVPDMDGAEAICSTMMSDLTPALLQAPR